VVSGGREVLIREPGGRLLAKVKRMMSRLYLLTVRMSAATLTVVREDPMAW
jgi:hypothetical protein